MLGQITASSTQVDSGEVDMFALLDRCHREKIHQEILFCSSKSIQGKNLDLLPHIKSINKHKSREGEEAVGMIEEPIHETIRSIQPNKRTKARKTDVNLLEALVNSFIPKDHIHDAKDDSNRNYSPEVICNFNFFAKSLNIFYYTRLNPWNFYGKVTKYLYEVGKLLLAFSAIVTHF